MQAASRPHSSRVLFSEAFVICAGSVLFRSDTAGRWQICVLHDRVEKVHVLPKGRKDCGESIDGAAVRETYEETGYPCKLLPCRMTTRAPLPHTNMLDEPRVVDDISEPFAITLRDLKEKGTKTIWWYLTVVSGGREEGTQTDSEDFYPEFFQADDAIRRLTFQDDKDIAQRALTLVDSYIAAGHTT
ncbi:hypothetical protein EDD16DRAFT_694260 [Pisolithus croceorrhizus]|nr:hypothetical protein EDD16DRAFT_694260 [Pisolithus croceorrhizus]